MKLEISDWKTVPYAEAWDRQTACFDALVHAKQAGEEYVNRIVLCEHPHVYTLGRSGKETNMLLGEEQLRAIGALSYRPGRRHHLSRAGAACVLSYPQPGGVLSGFERICASAGRSRNPRMRFLRDNRRTCGESHRRMVGRRFAACPQNLRYRCAQQPLCYDAWPGAQCQYGFTLFQLYPPLRVHRQRGDFASKGAGTGSAGRRSETAALP